MTRRRRVDPGKARQAAAGGSWYERITPRTPWETCSRCGGRSTVVGKDGECLKCLLERRKQAQKAIPEAGVPF